MYTKETLAEINQRFLNSHYFIDEYDVEKANRYVYLLESTRSTATPQPGDIVRYTNKWGDYYAHAHIESINEEGGAHICESPYVPFSWADADNKKMLFSTSGGAWGRIETNRMTYVGTEKKTFCDWGHCGPCANGAIDFEATVSVWEFDEHEMPYTTKTHNKMFIYRRKDVDEYGYKYVGDGRAWKDDLELQAWLETVRGEIIPALGNQTIVWYWKQKEVHVSPAEYEALNLPEDTMICNGSRRCKREYDEENHTVITYFVWYWEAPEMGDWREQVTKQNEIREKLYAIPCMAAKENELARRKIQTGLIPRIDFEKYFKGE